MVCGYGNGYKIINAKSKKVLDVMKIYRKWRYHIQYTSTGGNNQQWKFVNAGDGYYKIVSRSSGKLVDVYKWSTEDGAIIQQWSDAEGTNQHWAYSCKEYGTYPTPTVKPTPIPTNSVILGDLNGDLSVDSLDITLLKRYL